MKTSLRQGVVGCVWLRVIMVIDQRLSFYFCPLFGRGGRGVVRRDGSNNKNKKRRSHSPFFFRKKKTLPPPPLSHPMAAKMADKRGPKLGDAASL